MAKLGSAYIPNLESSFGGAVTPSVNHYCETPHKVKFAYDTGDFGGFTVEQDPLIWGKDVYGVVAIGRDAYAALPGSLRAETMDQAREIARGLNNLQARSAITIKPATNQSKKF